MDEHGQMSTNEEEIEALMRVYTVIQTARRKPFTTKSEFARFAANEVALCASEGFITTKVSDDTYSNTWMVTHDGLSFIEGVDDVSGD